MIDQKIRTPATLLGLSILIYSLLPGTAKAVSVMSFTDETTFLSALKSVRVDNFSDLIDPDAQQADFYPSPLERRLGAYRYFASADGDLYAGLLPDSTPVLSTALPVDLVFSFQTGRPTAVGGYFLATDIDFNIIDSLIIAYVNEDPSNSLAATGFSPAPRFFGWIGINQFPLTSLRVVPSVGSDCLEPNGCFATVSQLFIGQSQGVPAPAPLAGAVAGFVVSRRLRKRIRCCASNRG